jgi:hypothetical protein
MRLPFEDTRSNPRDARFPVGSSLDLTDSTGGYDSKRPCHFEAPSVSFGEGSFAGRFRVGNSSGNLLCRMGDRNFDRQFRHPAAAFLSATRHPPHTETSWCADEASVSRLATVVSPCSIPATVSPSWCPTGLRTGSAANITAGVVVRPFQGSSLE